MIVARPLAIFTDSSPAAAVEATTERRQPKDEAEKLSHTLFSRADTQYTPRKTSTASWAAGRASRLSSYLCRNDSMTSSEDFVELYRRPETDQLCAAW